MYLIEQLDFLFPFVIFRRRSKLWNDLLQRIEDLIRRSDHISDPKLERIHPYRGRQMIHHILNDRNSL